MQTDDETTDTPEPPELGQVGVTGSVEATCQHVGTVRPSVLDDVDLIEARAEVPGLSGENLALALALLPVDAGQQHPCSPYEASQTCAYEGSGGTVTHATALPSVDGSQLVLRCATAGPRVIFRYSLLP